MSNNVKKITATHAPFDRSPFIINQLPEITIVAVVIIDTHSKNTPTDLNRNLPSIEFVSKLSMVSQEVTSSNIEWTSLATSLLTDNSIDCSMYAVVSRRE